MANYRVTTTCVTSELLNSWNKVVEADSYMGAIREIMAPFPEFDYQVVEDGADSFARFGANHNIYSITAEQI